MMFGGRVFSICIPFMHRFHMLAGVVLNAIQTKPLIIEALAGGGRISRQIGPINCIDFRVVHTRLFWDEWAVTSISTVIPLVDSIILMDSQWLMKVLCFFSAGN